MRADTILESRKGASTTIPVQLEFEFPDLHRFTSCRVYIRILNRGDGSPRRTPSEGLGSNIRRGDVCMYKTR